MKKGVLIEASTDGGVIFGDRYRCGLYGEIGNYQCDVCRYFGGKSNEKIKTTYGPEMIVISCLHPKSKDKSEHVDTARFDYIGAYGEDEDEDDANIKSEDDIQSIAYRIFELIEPALKQAIAQAIEEHLK